MMQVKKHIGEFWPNQILNADEIAALVREFMKTQK
jgi:hypothetical protein